MVRQFRFALLAAGLLILAEGLTLALRVPVGAVALPPVHDLRVPGWRAGPIVATRVAPGTRGIIQRYTSATTHDDANIETRCSSDPKDFLKWTGRLAYLGAGYETTSTRTVPMRVANDAAHAGSLTESVVHDANGSVVIVYGYLDHWGVHAEGNDLYPRAVADLFTRHTGPYCMLGLALPARHGVAQAVRDAHALSRWFVPVIRRFVAT